MMMVMIDHEAETWFSPLIWDVEIFEFLIQAYVATTIVDHIFSWNPSCFVCLFVAREETLVQSSDVGKFVFLILAYWPSYMHWISYFVLEPLLLCLFVSCMRKKHWSGPLLGYSYSWYGSATTIISHIFLEFCLFAAWSKTLMSGPLLVYSYSATGPERSRKWIIIHHVKVFPIYPCISSSRPEQPKLISKQTFLEISDWSGQGVRASRAMKHWEHLVELPTPQMYPLLDNTICQSIKNFHERTKKRGKIYNNLNLNQPTRPQLQIDFVNCPFQIHSLCCQDENTSTTKHNNTIS